MIFSQQRYKIKEEDRQFLDYIPPLSILLGGLIFLIGTIYSIFLYETPKGSYQFYNQFLSELGIRNDYLETFSDGSTEFRYATSNPEIFNLTLFATGFLIIPFFIFSFRQMRNLSRFSNFTLFISIFCGTLTGPFLIGAGIFDLSYPSTSLLQEHGFWAAGVYLMISFTAISWLLMLSTAKMLPYKSTKWIIIDIVLLIVLVIIALLNILDGFGILLINDLQILNHYSIHTYQKLIAYFFFTYYGLVVGIRLTNTKYDNTPVIGTTFHCTNCGVNNPITAPFCTNCGVKLV